MNPIKAYLTPMMIPKSLFLSLFLSSMILLGGNQIALSQFAGDRNAKLGIFESGRKAWMQNLSVYGSYTFKRTAFFSEEDAHAKPIENEKSIVARGIIAKQRDKYRLQVLYLGEPRIVASGIFSNRSVDIIANKQYWFYFNPDQGKDYGPAGSLNRIDSRPIKDIILDLISTNTPLCLSILPIDDMPSETTITDSPIIENLADGRVKISLKSMSKADVSFVKNVYIDMKDKYPVVEQIELLTYKSNGVKHLNTFVKKTTEWKTIDDQKIPSCIRTINGPLKAVGKTENSWIVSEWKSEDLDKRQPTSKDFTLTLDQNDHLIGMKSYPKNGLYDIDKISDDDFMEVGVDHGSYDAHKNKSGRYNWFRYVLMGVGLVLIVFSCISIYRKKKGFE